MTGSDTIVVGAGEAFKALLLPQAIRVDALASGWRQRIVGGRNVIVVADYAARIDLRSLHGELESAGISYLLVWIDCKSAAVGPYVSPNNNNCPICVAVRASWSGSTLANAIGGLTGQSQVATAPKAWRPLAGVLLGLIGRRLTGLYDEDLVVTLDYEEKLLRAEYSYRSADCPACMAANVPLTADAIGGQGIGPHRTLADLGDVDKEAPATEKLLMLTLGQGAGLVRTLRRQEDGAIPTTVVSSRIGHATTKNARVLTLGRSARYETADRIAIFEALERYAGFAPQDTPVVLASRDELGDHAVDPRSLVLHSADQYALRDFPFRPYSDSMALQWVAALSTMQNRSVLVPRQNVYYGASRSPGTVGVPQDNLLAYETSNGFAVGPSLHRAALSALLEVIERDAFLWTWYNQAAPQLLSRDVFKDYESHNVRALLEMRGYQVSAFDITRSSTGVPTVWVLVQNRYTETPTSRIASLSGAASSPCLESSAAKALSEVAAGIPDLENRYRTYRTRANQLIHDHRLVQTMDDHSLYYACPESQHRLAFLGDPTRRAGQAASEGRWGGDNDDALPKAMLSRVIRSLHRQGHDVMVVDATRRELARLGLRAARVLVPGLLPLTFGVGNHRTALIKTAKAGASRQVGTDDYINSLGPHPFP